MKDYSNKAVIDSLNLPMITSFDDLTQQLRLSPNLVYWISSNSTNRYKTYYLPKRNKTLREINAPVLSLKMAQKWVLFNILYKIKVSPYSFGFLKSNTGSPLVECAEKHRNNLYILKMDIENFYPSISRNKVYYQFINIGYNSSVANLLTNICTYNDCLPQGAVTSAYLANIICRNLDYRISGYCNKREIVYTRYADDMVFSSDNRTNLKIAHAMICEILKDEGFNPNAQKTRFMTPKNHKQILGITVNDNLTKAPKEMKRKVRAMIHYSIANEDYSNNEKIRGYVAYISSIEDQYQNKVKKYIRKLIFSELCCNNNLVDTFNNNKIYSDLPDMKFVKPTDMPF